MRAREQFKALHHFNNSLVKYRRDYSEYPVGRINKKEILDE